MKKLRESKTAKPMPRKKPREPLEEGICVPVSKTGRMMWGRMSDEQLVAFARKIIQEKGISGRSRLSITVGGLYNILRARKLLDDAFEGVKQKKRTYPEDPDEFVKQAREFILENGISSRSEFIKKDPSVYNTLRRRKLLDAVFEGIKQKNRTYPEDSEELVNQANQFMQENGITSRRDLQEKDRAFYSVLRRRKLLDAVFDGIPLKYRSYPKDPEELVRYARDFIHENGISSRKELSKRSNGLYEALRTRKLLGAAFKGVEKYPKDPDELVRQARQFIKENGISGKYELRKKNSGLYAALWRRKLLDVAFEGVKLKQRHYPKNPDELVKQARKFIQENGITSRSELVKKDNCLYQVLCRRKLLDAAFLEVTADQQKAAVQEVLDELRDFGDKR